MSTKIFLCWSGARSRRLADTLAEWLPAALGNKVETSMSTHIEKGAEWFEELLTALDNAACGIMCLTPEAMESRWIHFESGLLARAVTERGGTPSDGGPTRRLFPLLYGVESGSLVGPLGSYQSTVITDVDDVIRLLAAIYAFVPEADRDGADAVRPSWRKRWTALQLRLADMPAIAPKEVIPDLEELFRRKTFQESVYDCLSQEWIDRYNGARDTQLRLKQHAGTVRQACRPFIADVFDELVAVLDSYAMGLSKLVGRPESPIDPATGRLVFESPGLAVACERLRTKVRQLLSRLVDDRLAPTLDQAFRFENAETFEEKKRLVHRATADLDRYQGALRERGADSDWALDRILYYVWEEERSDPRVEETIYRTRIELEKLTAKTAGWSLMPLSYSLGPLEKSVRQGPMLDAAVAEQVHRLTGDVRAFIERTKTDSGAQVRAALTRIEMLLPARDDSQAAGIVA